MERCACELHLSVGFPKPRLNDKHVVATDDTQLDGGVFVDAQNTPRKNETTNLHQCDNISMLVGHTPNHPQTCFSSPNEVG